MPHVKGKCLAQSAIQVKNRKFRVGFVHALFKSESKR